jgi:hypothetical protein
MSKAPIMTAYRQQALACAASLSNGPRRTTDVKSIVPDAPKILLRNVYGWFCRVERGVYALTPAGTRALERWPQPSVPHSCPYWPAQNATFPSAPSAASAGPALIGDH